MKAKETKKMIKKAVRATQTVTARNAEPKKVVKPSDDKTSKMKKSPFIKTAAKTEKKAPKKKATTIKTEVKVTPRAKVEIKPKSMGSKASAAKSKPVEKAETKKALKPSGIKATRTVSSEKKAIEAKREQAVPVKPLLKSGAAAEKYDTGEEPKSTAERYLAKNSGARLKIFLPDQDFTKEEAEEIFFGGLPEAYGENSVIALVVDPNTVFVDWEVIPKDISDKEGSLNLRFYDITDIEFNDWNVHSVLDVLINKRVGNGFFDIRWPGRDVVVALGIFNAVSGFMPIVWSDMISFPELLAFDELGIVQKLFESGIPVGY